MGNLYPPLDLSILAPWLLLKRKGPEINLTSWAPISSHTFIPDCIAFQGVSPTLMRCVPSMSCLSTPVLLTQFDYCLFPALGWIFIQFVPFFLTIVIMIGRWVVLHVFSLIPVLSGNSRITRLSGSLLSLASAPYLHACRVFCFANTRRSWPSSSWDMSFAAKKNWSSSKI